MVNSMTGGPGGIRRLHASHLPGPADVFWRKREGKKVGIFSEKWWVFMDFHGKEMVFMGVFLMISDGTLWKYLCFFEDFWWETRWFNDFEWWFNGGHTSYCKLNRMGTPNQEWAILDDPKKYVFCPNFNFFLKFGRV